MNMIRRLVCPDWPTNWLLGALAEKIIGERGPNQEMQDEADEIFEIALDKLIPPDPPDLRLISGEKR
jgi:hypothetical protein